MKRQLLLINLLLFIKNIINQATLDAFISDKESQLKLLAKKVEEVYGNRCSAKNLKCDTCSYLACTENKPATLCDSGLISSSCNTCNNKGTIVSKDLSNIIKVPNVDYNLQNIKEEVCTTVDLDSIFIQNTNDEILFQKYVSSNGVYRRYPYVKDCENRDPFFFDWYVNAATGPKKFVLIIDASESTKFPSTKGNRIELIKKACENLIDMLSINDWVSVVVMRTMASFFNSEIVRATVSVKKSIKTFISKIVASGLTNFDDALNRAFDILSLNKQDQFGDAPCRSIIVMMTDGFPTSGELNSQKLIQKYYLKSIQVKATIISYSISKASDKFFFNTMTCFLGKGFWNYIPDVKNIYYALGLYYKPLIYSQGALNQITYTENYQDSEGYGEIITMSMPVYDKSKNPQIFLGVVSMDIKVKSLLKYDNLENVLKFLVKRNKLCTSINITANQLEFVRGIGFCGKLPPTAKSYFQTKPTNCIKANTPIAICGNFSKSDISKSFCCGSDSVKCFNRAIMLFFKFNILISLILIIFFFN